MPEVAHRGRREPEVDALDEAVDRRDHDTVAARHRRVVTGAHHDPAAALAEAGADRVDQVELDTDSDHSGTAITSMYAHSMTVAAINARERLIAASGSTQIAYQGTSQAVATQHRERRPAGRETQARGSSRSSTRGAADI